MKVLVTGTSSGIGKEIAKLFLERGHEVVGFDIKESSITHYNYTHYVCDISKCLPEVENVQILINNAGIQDDDLAIKINLESTINVTEKYGINSNIKSILFIASASARNGAEFPKYSASKGGVVSYMKNVALRVSKFSATANSISPGGVITKVNDHILNNKKLYDAVLNETLLNKWCDPREIAEWAYFITVINKSMTGEDILIDNGEILKSNFIW